MNHSTYLLKSNKLKGYIQITYLNGFLKQIKFDLNEPMKAHKFIFFKDFLPQQEADIARFEKLGFELTKESTPTPEGNGTNIKIALFCRMYEKYTTVKYKVSPADSGKIKLLNVDDALLKHYFTSQNFLFKNKYSIANLSKYYNELLAEIATAGKSQYPNHYDKAYEAKLPLSQISGYWLHLRSLGLEPKKDRLGNTVNWVITPNKND